MHFMHKESEQNVDIAALRLQWGFFAVVCTLFLAGGVVVFWFAWQPVLAARWAALSAIILAYQLIVLWRNLPANHRPGEEQLLPDLGWGNRLTLLRGIFVAAMLGFLFLPQPASWLAWLPGILYILSDTADFFDGYVARVTQHATRLGEILDMSFDGLGVLAAVLLPLFSPPGTHIAAALFGLPLLAGFLRDGLYVSGVLRPRRGLPAKSRPVLERGLPIGLRLLVLVLNAYSIAGWITEFPNLSSTLALLGLVNTLVVTLLILGVLPRITAILALCLLGFYQMIDHLSAVQIILAATYTLILYIGGGAFSLWSPEEYLFRNRAGEQKRSSAGIIPTEECAGCEPR